MLLIFTLLSLLLMTGLVIVLRVCWPRLSPEMRLRVAVVAVAILVVPWIERFTGWESVSIRLNQLSLWVCILGYEVCVIFFTLLRPRWLTIPIAVPLLLLIFSSSVLAPLSALFAKNTYKTLPLGHGYFVETTRWTSGPGENSGVDWDVFYRPAAPGFLRRGTSGGRLYNTQCRTDAVFGTLNLAAHTLTLHCPSLTPGGPESEHLVRLR